MFLCDAVGFSQMDRLLLKKGENTISNSIQCLKSKGKIGFSISVAGPRVGKARVSVDDFAEKIRRTQQALKRIGQVLYGESSIGKGRRERPRDRISKTI
jgi:hypothetical protein